MNTKSKQILWAAVFAVLLLLSFDYWTWQNPVVLSWGGFPSWVFYFVVLQIVFVGVIWAFTKFYWKEE